MADAVTTVTRKEYSNGIKLITVNMVCATAAAAFTDALIEERGKRLLQVTVVPGTTGPSDNSDLAITDSVTGINLMTTNGADIVDNATTSQVAPDLATNVIQGALTIGVSGNSEDNAETTIYLVFTKNI